MATVLFTACGGGGGSDGGSSTSAASSTAQEGRPALNPTAPITKQLGATFPKPKVEPGAPSGTAKAIAVGRRACAGKTPVEVRDEFISAAEGGAGLNEGQKEMVEEIAKFEKQASHSPNFAAGQLAAGVYEATLPEKERVGGYQGCVYELAVQLRKELAKSKK